MNSLKITIPEPCHENWDKMTPNNNGRYCNSCNKTVVDFTQKSPTEISTFISTAEGKVCGRFKTKHLYNPTVIDASKNYLKPGWFRSRWMAMFALVSFVSFGKKANAQMQGQVVAKNPDAENKFSVKPNSTVIHGWIKNSKTRKGIADVEIRIYSGGKEIAYHTSFANGSYFITIPASTIYDFKIDLEFNHASSRLQVLKDLPINKDRIKCDANLVTMLVGDDDSIGEITDPEYPVEPLITMGEPGPGHGSEGLQGHPGYGMAPLLNKDTLMNDTSTYNVKKIDENIIPLTINAQNTDFKVTAYPNPGPGLFNFKIDNSEKSEIFIFDLEGKLVASKKTTASVETVDITTQPNGTYVVRIVSMSQNKVKQIKVVKAN